MDYTPTTKLEAVNALLEVINESPINSLDVDIPQAEEAITMIERVSKEVQTAGLNCNSEYNYSLVVDDEGYINVSKNTLSVISDDEDLVLRGLKLYDRTNHTYKFTSTKKVNIVFYLPFETLPEHVRNYVVALARHRFQAVKQTDATLDKMLQDELRTAIALFRQKEIREQSISFLSSYYTHPSYRRLY